MSCWPLAHQLGAGEGPLSAWSGWQAGHPPLSFSTVWLKGPNSCLLPRNSEHEWAASGMTFQVPRAA